MDIINLSGKSLEATTITRNTIVSYGDPVLRLTRDIFSPSFFGVKITLNDFFVGNYLAVVLTSPTYNLPSELSLDGRGNYWGISGCPGFDPSSVRFGGIDGFIGEVNPYVVDSHPYMQPVANTPDALLPATCP
jgi:hypothetical protein